MRIGVDGTCWTNRRGYGRFTRELLSAALLLDSRNEYIFLVDHESLEFPLPPGVRVCRVANSLPTIEAAGAHSNRSARDLWAFRKAAASVRADVIFFPTVYSYVPLFSTAGQIVTIHDAIPEMFPDLVFPTLRSRILWSVKRRMAVRQAELVVTVSDYSRRCLVEKLGIRGDRIRVVSEAADPRFRPQEVLSGGNHLSRWGLPANAKILIYVGGFSPHKNLSMLLDVVSDLIRRGEASNVFVVLVGDHEKDAFNSCYLELANRAHGNGLQGRVIFTGHLGDDELVPLLNRSHALVLPSFSEGFGLPGLEAAACGTPVIATTESPLASLLGDGMLAVAPSDRAGWIEAIQRLLTDGDLRARMSAAARSAASRLTWNKSARELLSVFDEFEERHGAAA